MGFGEWVYVFTTYDDDSVVPNWYTRETVDSKMRLGILWMLGKDGKKIKKVQVRNEYTKEMETIYYDKNLEEEPMENEKELVVLPKEVADSLADWINHYRRRGITDEEARKQVNAMLPSSICKTSMVEAAISEESSKVAEYAKGSKDNLFKINSALINGFTITEQSPEEQLVELYNEYKSVAVNNESYFVSGGKMYGIEETLSILGIEIEGINK